MNDPGLNNLLKWGIQNSEASRNDASAAVQPMTDIDRTALQNLINNMQGPSDMDLMKESMTVIENAKAELDAKYIAFENFEMLIENIDNANNLVVEHPVKSVDTLKAEHSVEDQYSPKAEDPVKAEDSVEVQDMVKTEDSVEVQDSAKAEDPVKAGDSVQVQDLVKTEDSVENQDSGDAEEKKTESLWSRLIKQLENEDPELRWRAATCCGTAVQNNIKAQEQLLTRDAAPTLVKMATTDLDKMARKKAVYALSSLVRNFQPGLDATVSHLPADFKPESQLDANDMASVDTLITKLREHAQK